MSQGGREGGKERGRENWWQRMGEEEGGKERKSTEVEKRKREIVREMIHRHRLSRHGQWHVKILI